MPKTIYLSDKEKELIFEAIQMLIDDYEHISEDHPQCHILYKIMDKINSN